MIQNLILDHAHAGRIDFLNGFWYFLLCMAMDSSRETLFPLPYLKDNEIGLPVDKAALREFIKNSNI